MFVFSLCSSEVEAAINTGLLTLYHKVCLFVCL